MTRHIYYSLSFDFVNTYQASQLLNENSVNSMKDFKTNLLILTIAGITYSIIAYVFDVSLVTKLDNAYDGAIQLLRRIHPLAILTNHDLKDFLENKRTKKEQISMTISKSVIMYSRDAVICLSRNKSIEVVNKSVSNIFDYIPEQL